MEQTRSVTEQERRPGPQGPGAGQAATSGLGSILWRTVVGLGILGVLAAILWLDYWVGLRLGHGVVLAGLGVVVVLGGTLEYCRMARLLGAGVSRLLVTTAGVALLLGMWAGWAFGGEPGWPAWFAHPGMTAAAVMVLVALGVLAGRALTGAVEGTAQAVAMSVLGLVYVALPLAFVAALREGWPEAQTPGGPSLGLMRVIATLAVCKATDVGGYFAGRLLGGPRIAPTVSPRKTLSGALGGTLLATGTAVGFAAAGWSGMSIRLGLLFGVLMTAAAITGDLAESVLKREAGIKDSGSLLHGQGGVLDMVDDVIFVAPLSYLFFALMR